MSKLRIILGAMEIGRGPLSDYAPSSELLSTFLAKVKGHSELDTALLYAGGDSEKIIGQYIKNQGALASRKVSIATKVNPWSERGLTRTSVLKQVATSLESLQTNCVDLLYLHSPDHNTPIEETLGAIQEVYKEGKFKELGLSNYSSWEVADVYHVCKRNGWVMPTVYQGMYNPITRIVEDELLPALRYFGLRFYAYNPLAGGLLSGRYRMEEMDKPSDGRFWTIGGENLTKMYRDRFWRESSFRGMELVRKTLEEAYGADKVSLVSATFRWLNHHSAMKPEHNDGIILGASKLNHLVANISACEEGPLDERVVKAFDKAWLMDKAHCPKYFR